ncbi:MULTISPECIES: YnfU family zinc-binding protein [Hafnia]|nr:MULTISPECIES: YnfU family zinc-binding protein [Hafnia]MBW3477553.1 YnfU family zinc-binding protein [Hafnia alvei]MCE9873918.1 YnfU family zinc-binding protein [Hafnia alvei]MCV9376416.1 YnfU family zinc-binding protein [Hafnia alvei]MDX6844043.1 YnfU family zinc-binding protein [Hafnia alvei]MEB7888754.1 YnfU family zinc-binding protein [Hafnia alvei]
MSFFDGLKLYSTRSIQITCPKCSHVSEQSVSKIRKNTTLICTRCGEYFLPNEIKTKE